MATPTYDLLDSTTLASSASSVTFTNIDQSYGDLVLVMSPISDTGYGETQIALNFNGDTGSNYAWVRMGGTGSTTVSSDNSSATFVYASGGTGPVEAGGGIWISQIMDYSATDKHKSVLSRSNRADEATYAIASRWANTSAVTSITIGYPSDQYAAGSSFYLYGISK